MPSKSFIARDRKSMPGFKASKDKTDLLGAKAAGDSKLKPNLIDCSDNPRVFYMKIMLNLPSVLLEWNNKT